MFGIKQDALAFDLNMSQQAVSLLEQKEILDVPVLEKVAKILGVPEDAIRNFNEDSAINIITNTFNSHDNSFAHKCTFNINPIDKWMEALEENKRLYERLLQAEKEKNELLQKLLDKK